METVEQLVSFQHIQVQLLGGAPWGFTVKGGLEYGEPLVITKIEEDGKAAQCKKLRVGDELININGSVLYGSRQEALILIKGSYRALRMAVRRRVVPVIRPHSWHLAKLSETPSPAASDAPPAMQLHPRPFSAPWHSEGVSSDLSMQWNHLSRHCSTDRSSSIGSMESLDPPSQGYYDNQSPIDPAIFSNKRDSAYSSFSASSNTSDYTISLLPDEASSMDNLLHSLGSCRYADGDCPDSNFHRELNSKTLSPSRSLRDKVRPSSYGCEEEPGRVRGRGPPQPPARSDSFRATRGILKTRDKRSASAPVDIVSVSGCWVEGPLKVQTQDLAECSRKLSVNEDCQAGCALEQHCTRGSQPEPCGARSRPPPSQPTSPAPADLSCSKTPAEGVGESAASPDITEALGSCHLLGTASKKSSAGGHRHSAPEKLLLAHHHTEGLSGDPEESHINPVTQWSRSPFYPGQELEGTRGTGTVTHGMWSGSRCSSCTTLVTSEPLSFVSIPSQLSTQQTRDSSINVPGEVTKGNSLPDPTWDAGTLQEEVEIVTGAAGNVLKEGGERGEDPRPLPKLGSSRQRRLSKSRRRSERFATNLRNEIQRKKAELLKSTGSTSLLYGEDMLKEEEGVEQHFQDSACAEICQPSAQLENACSSPALLTSSQLSTTSSIDLLTPHVSHSTDLDSSGSQPSNQVRPSYGQVVEEPAPAGKARRWRWTPEYKLPPRLETERRTDREGSVAVVTLQGTNASTNSCPSTNSENCDIPPFADRRKFFEETSRSVSMTNLPVLMSQHQRPETQRRPQYTAKLDPPGHKTEPHQRRYSYQGATNQDISRYCHLVGRRKTVSSSYNQEQEKEDTGLGHFSSDRLHKPAEQNVTPCLPVDDGRRSISYYQQPCEHYNPQDPPAPSNALLESLDYTQKQSEHSQKIPIEVPLPGVRETTKPNRFSLTDREYLLCRQDPQQADGVRAGQGGDPLVAGRLSVFSVTEPEVQHPHQGRALSENDIRLDPWRLQTPAASSQESAGKNPEESAGVLAIKRPLPPPRPPLPDWELYRHRKASPQKLSSPYRQLCSESLSSPDVTRHRSHSLPLREEPERGQDGFHVQSGSASPCKSFTRILPEPRLSVSETASNADQEVRWVATQWMDSPMYADQRISATSATEGSSKSDEEKRQQGELHDKMSFRGPEPGSAPDHSVVGEEEGGPFETDVDQLQEGAVEGLAKDVLQCFALTGKMLETDIDQLPGVEDPTLALPRPHSTSPVDALLAEEANSYLMEELFQQTDAGETCKSTWRSRRRVLELSVDTLERRARQGASNTEGPGSNCSSYYNTSTAKAQLLNKMKQHSGLHEENDKLSYKKTLVDSLQRKLAVLREAQRGLQEDVQANAQLGQEVEALVLAFCKPAEVDKFHMFVGDLDKVVSLLLSLSGRLLRVESALEGLSPDISHHEWLPLLEKKQQLQAQLGEAQELKEHVDRREQAVRQALGRCLTPEQLADYGHYVKMKASLLVEQRQLEDKIRLGEEQLRGLRESLGLGVGEAVGQAFG